MRITFISPTVNMGGGTKVVVIYAERLMRKGHIVRIISPPPRSISLTEKLKLWLRGNSWPGGPLPPMSYLEGTAVKHQVLDRWRPVSDYDVPDGDAVIATWWETAEWVNTFSPKKGAKVYFIQHHEVFPHLPALRSRATYRLPFHKVVIARWLKDLMRTEYADDNVDLVPNSVDTAQFFASVRGKQSIPTVGFLYATTPFKGLDVTLAALQSVRERYPNLRLVCFGSEPVNPESAAPGRREISPLPAAEPNPKPLFCMRCLGNS